MYFDDDDDDDHMVVSLVRTASLQLSDLRNGSTTVVGGLGSSTKELPNPHECLHNLFEYRKTSVHAQRERGQIFQIKILQGLERWVDSEQDFLVLDFPSYHK